MTPGAESLFGVYVLELVLNTSENIQYDYTEYSHCVYSKVEIVNMSFMAIVWYFSVNVMQCFCRKTYYIMNKIDSGVGRGVKACLYALRQMYRRLT